eukprot:366441-Chlamydomonas_euryale.AAC.24
MSLTADFLPPGTVQVQCRRSHPPQRSPSRWAAAAVAAACPSFEPGPCCCVHAGNGLSIAPRGLSSGVDGQAAEAVIKAPGMVLICRQLHREGIFRSRRGEPGDRSRGPMLLERAMPPLALPNFSPRLFNGMFNDSALFACAALASWQPK